MHVVFFIKLLLATACLLASITLLYVRPPVLERTTPPWLIIAYYAARLALLAVAFFVLHFKYQGENTFVYFYYGDLTLQGKIPNRDFFEVYGILFTYLIAAGVWLRHDPFVIYVVLQLSEFLPIYVLFTQKNIPLSLRSFLGYAVNPIVVVVVWLGAQNQVLCLIPLAALFAVRNEEVRSVWYALGFSLSKLFALWTIIPALAFQRFRSIVVCGAVTALIYLPFLLLGSQGISLKATQLSGEIFDDANSLGAETLLLYLPQPASSKVGHIALKATEGVLLLVMAAALCLRLRLGERRIAGLGLERKALFVCILAMLMTLIFQAFSPYTVPEYLGSAVAFIPLLAKSGFWRAGDQILFAFVSFLQVLVFLLMFHSGEILKGWVTTSPTFLVCTLLQNLCLLALLAAFVGKTVTFFRREIA
jgi:hypothetical protein